MSDDEAPKSMPPSPPAGSPPQDLVPPPLPTLTATDPASPNAATDPASPASPSAFSSPPQPDDAWHSDAATDPTNPASATNPASPASPSAFSSPPQPDDAWHSDAATDPTNPASATNPATTASPSAASNPPQPDAAWHSDAATDPASPSAASPSAASSPPHPDDAWHSDAATNPGLRVQLEGFDGPLDLLLHLVRTHRLDIQALQLAHITSPYLAYLEEMGGPNLEVGASFLRIAAALVWIKSKTLLPQLSTQDDDEEEEDSLDPQALEEMLLYRLQRYQQFKDSAQWLAERKQLGRDVFPRTPALEDTNNPQSEALEEASLYGLMSALQRLLKRAEDTAEVVITLDDSRVEETLRGVMIKLSQANTQNFHSLLPAQAGRIETIAVFLALLELARLGALQLVQSNPHARIMCIASDLLKQNPQKMEHHVLRGFYGDGR